MKIQPAFSQTTMSAMSEQPQPEYDVNFSKDEELPFRIKNILRDNGLVVGITTDNYIVGVNDTKFSGFIPVEVGYDEQYINYDCYNPTEGLVANTANRGFVMTEIDGSGKPKSLGVMDRPCIAGSRGNRVLLVPMDNNKALMEARTIIRELLGEDADKIPQDSEIHSITFD